MLQKSWATPSLVRMAGANRGKETLVQCLGSSNSKKSQWSLAIVLFLWPQTTITNTQAPNGQKQNNKIKDPNHHFQTWVLWFSPLLRKNYTPACFSFVLTLRPHSQHFWHQMCGFFHPYPKRFWDTSCMSYNSTQFWQYPPGESITHAPLPVIG